MEENKRAEVGGLECQSLGYRFKVLTSRVMKTDISNKRELQ